MKNNTMEHEKKAKKDRVVWSEDLHHKFVNAVNNSGGIDKATPKKILLLMKGENLTKGNVASHLQKYRLHLKRVSSTFHQNRKGLAQFHEINDVGVHNGYQSGVSQAIPTSERVSNQGPDPLFNGTFSQWLHDNENMDFNFYENENWDFNFDYWDHGNGMMELSEENSSLMEQHQGNFGNEQQHSQSNCMAANLGLVQESVNTSSGCSSQESHGIAELRHEITTVRHENSQLMQTVQAMKARQDMLEQLLLQRTFVQPERLTKQ